jgi:hypothetical protein
VRRLDRDDQHRHRRDLGPPGWSFWYQYTGKCSEAYGYHLLCIEK